MPNVVKKDIDNLNATLTVELKADEYGKLYEQKLKEYRGKMQMPGFRQGKTPLSLVRKMYGPSVLSEIVDKQINEAVTNFLVEEKLGFLGNPIPSEEQAEQTLDHQKLQDITFSFDLGLVPEFELDEKEDKHKFPKYEVKIEKKLIDDEIENILRRFGKQEPTDEKIVEDDILRLRARELDGKKPKEEGHETDIFSVAFKDLTQSAAKKVKSKKAGFSFTHDIYDLEEGADEKRVQEYFIQAEPEAAAAMGKEFELTIDEVIRLTPAEPTQEVFEQYFGAEKATSEEEARQLLEEDFRKYYDNQADAILFKDMQKYLIEKYEDKTPLPEEFLKRWLLSRNSENDLSQEELEKDFPLFAEDLRWRLIKDKLLEKHEIQIDAEDVREGFRRRFLQYLGGQSVGEEIVDQMIDRAMENREQVENVQQEVVTGKLFDKLKEVSNLQKKSITEKKFRELQEEYSPKQG